MAFLSHDNVVTVGFDKREAQATLMTCAEPTGAPHFGDALIAITARSAGIEEIYSFDRRFARAGLIPLIPE